MSEDRILTGIEVELNALGANQTVVKILHALHLDSAVARFQSKNIQLRVVVDGAATDFPLHSHYFVECEPGEHEVEVALLGSLDVTKLGQHISNRKLRVSVAPGEITMVNYGMGIGIASYELAIAGTRPG